jgi:hypothetical protein
MASSWVAVIKSAFWTLDSFVPELPLRPTEGPQENGVGG